MSQSKLNNVLLFPASGAAFHLIPKVASQSVSAAARDTTHMNINVDAEIYIPVRRFMAVRDPRERLVSAWAFFCRGTPEELEGCPNLQEIGYYHQMPFDEFVDLAIENQDRDDHTRQQVQYGGSVNWSATDINTLVPLDKLSKLWPRLMEVIPGLRKLPNQNRSDHGEWATYYTRDMWYQAGNAYARDLALLKMARARWG